MSVDELDNLYEEQARTSRWPMILVLAVILVVLAFIAWDQRPQGVSETDPGGIGMLTTDLPDRGAKAPNFALENEAGERFVLADFEGRPVFLNFWATWCTFCKEEMPDMQRVQDEYGDDLVVIGVNVGESIEDGEAFARKAGITYLRLYDTDQSVTDGYRVQAMPTSYFIAPDGSIAEANFGFMVYEQMVEKVESAIQG